MAVAGQVIIVNCFPGGVTAASRVVSWQHGLLLQKIREWYVRKLDTKLMGQGFPWESYTKPLPFPCLTLTTNSQVCSNNPSSALLWGFFFSTIVWIVRKENRLGHDLYVRLSPCIISPPAEVQSSVPWTGSGDLMSFLSVARGSLVGCVPTPALTSPLVGTSVTGCLSCSGMWVYEPVIVFWQQGLYVKKGKWQCVLTNAAVGSRVSCWKAGSAF